MSTSFTLRAALIAALATVSIGFAVAQTPTPAPQPTPAAARPASDSLPVPPNSLSLFNTLFFKK